MKSLHCVRRCAAALALVAAGGSAGWAQGTADLALLNVATLPIASQTDVWVAQQRGMFAKNGINAKITQFGISGPAINAMQGGSIDVLLVIVGLGMTAMQQNFDLLPVFQDEVGHLTPPDSATLQVLATSPIKQLSELAGKKVGVGGLTTQNTILTKHLLQKAGVDIKTVQFVETTFPSMPTALKMGQVDAVAAIDPFSTQLYSSGTGKVLAWNYVETIPQQPIGVWFAKGSVAKAKPQLIEGFVRSMKEAVDYLKADEKRARQEIVAYTRLDADLIDKMPLINWDYQVRPDKWQAVIDLMAESGQMRPQKADEFLTSPHIQQFIVR
ncbi:MAG: NitT/TauT family transport system substrate-binding protein [Alphaproteobacteria bacterium]|jgi:NitT/TauT family transport system substrate-binding protein|nr:NitT/TauT family transport system substrate-binding protein [Alphaproteobacteria bacterium]